MHAAAPEARGFADRIEPRHDLTVLAEHAGVKVGLEAAQRLARQDIELHCDQRTVRGIEDAMRLRGADQAIADIAARIVDVHHLGVLDIGIGDFAIARLDLRLQMLDLQQIVARKRVHRADERFEVVAYDEIRAVGLECFHRRRSGLAGGALGGHPPAFSGQIRVLLRTRQREFLLDDALGQYKPRIIVTGTHDVLQLAERVGARKQRRGQPLALSVEPHWRGPRQNADAVPRPDR